MIISNAARTLAALACLAAIAGCGRSAKEIQERLSGTWTAVEVTEQGKPLAPGARYKGTVKFDKEFAEQSLSVEGDPKPRAWLILKGKYTIDPSREPAQIDFAPPDGQEGGQPRLGIFEFDDGKLKLCVAAPGQPRPTSLIGLSEGETLMVLEKK